MTEQMIAEALLLADAINNKESRVVNYLIFEARKLAIRATSQLIGADPSDAVIIQSLQGQATRYADLISWIRNAMENAAMAATELSQEDLNTVEGELWGPQEE